MQNYTIIKVNVETWIANALLHKEHSDREDFTVGEIVERAEHEAVAGVLRPGVRVHATLHCVANLPPNPGRYRMLFATAKGRRRLFRPGDPFHPDRQKGKIVPEKEELPEKYWGLLDWYHNEYARSPRRRDPSDSILALAGCGRELWQDEDADTYVRRLREGWQ
jgi:hypothetical protein